MTRPTRWLPERRLLVMMAYGFIAGLPRPLVGFTLLLWLSDGGVSLAVIGLAAWIAIPYSVKFLWAPILDRPPPSRALRALGRRRGWLLLIQLMLVLAVVGLALSDPGVLVLGVPALSFFAAACIAFLSATQDLVIDAWRIEVFPAQRQGVALAVYVWGYRLAVWVSTTVIIGAAAIVGWKAALLGVAFLATCGCLVTLLAPAETVSLDRSATGFRHSVIAPVRLFLMRPSAWMIIAFVALFNLGEGIAGLMTAPFYRHLGFDKAAIAWNGTLSLWATLFGIAMGGWLVARIGVGRALLLTGWTQTVAMAMYVVLAGSSGNHAILYATVTLEAFAQGMAAAAFLTFLSALCAREFAATQYALLSSLSQLSNHTIGAVAGVMAASLGWPLFYTVCIGSALPGMVLMLLLLRRQRAVPAAVDPGRMTDGDRYIGHP